MDILGFIIQILVTIVIVAIVEQVSKTELPYGWIGNIIAGLIGGWIGQQLLGHSWGPSLGGVMLIQTFIGAFILIVVVKWALGQLAKRK